MEVESKTDVFLQHYGIMGMKWGVRRTDAQLDAARAKKTKKKSKKANREPIGKRLHKRVERAAIDKNQSALDRAKRAKSGNATALDILENAEELTLIDIIKAGFNPKKGADEYLSRKLSTLEDKQDRLESGKKSLSRVLEMYGDVFMPGVIDEKFYN